MSKTELKNSMMLTTTNWGKDKSFNLIPVVTDCPYVEALYNPAASTLAIIGKTKKETFHMIPRLDANGHPEQLKVVNNSQEPYKKQRVQQESYTEYYITDKKEIEDFIKLFAINSDSYNYKQYLDSKVSEGLITQPELIK
ncbi:MAG TPA: hypothetical protein PLG47_05960 [Candidatus Dojkabacteria bacterium]|nr:hypothetical protein [Candidatus Dojkabacteria bacterium]